MGMVCQIRYSKDGGHNWSPWREADMGSTGQFIHPVEFRRLGSAAQEWIFEISMSYPMKRDLMGASWQPEQTG